MNFTDFNKPTTLAEREAELAHEDACCECGTLLEGQYNNGEEHDECAICREGRLTDEAYEQVKEAR